jgi:hypothetical protein
MRGKSARKIAETNKFPAQNVGNLFVQGRGDFGAQSGCGIVTVRWCDSGKGALTDSLGGLGK